MSPAEEPISPEEKLLNLIKGKKADASQGSTEPVPTVVGDDTSETGVDPLPPSPQESPGPTPPVSAAAASASAEQPRLRLARRETDSTAPASQLAAGPAAPNDLIGADSVPVVGRKTRPAVMDVGAVNRMLAAIIVVILCFGLYQIWANVNSMQLGRPPPLKPVLPPLASTEQVAGARDVVKAWEGGPPLIMDPADWTSGIITNVVVHPPPVPVKLSFKGISRNAAGATEAVLVEQDVGKMHWVVAGQKFRAGDTELEVVEIRGDRLVLRRGNDLVTIHPKAEQSIERGQ
ncbi:MAG: hypothetical protein ACUVWX_00435 [Kiritimatiellia bacterium]